VEVVEVVAQQILVLVLEGEQVGETAQVPVPTTPTTTQALVEQVAVLIM
jgi:hypothetical protein